ncbi:hypothetical protein BUE80_DR000741 [Diplocarpon rosae]|nr:hypothetical protein BUE80_DR000741 [Diplocarpon rosae]
MGKDKGKDMDMDMDLDLATGRVGEEHLNHTFPAPDTGLPRSWTYKVPPIYLPLIVDPPKMCEYTKNYYIYTSCVDPGAHFFSTSMDGKKERRCSRGPHERYIVVPGHCPLCGS